MQREMPFFQDLSKEPKEADMGFVRKVCRSAMDALQLTLQLSKLKHDYIAGVFGITKGHWSKMMNGAANPRLDDLPNMMRLCGNIAFLQWLADEMGYELVKKKQDQRIAELEEELQRLKAEQKAA